MNYLDKCTRPLTSEELNNVTFVDFADNKIKLNGKTVTAVFRGGQILVHPKTIFSSLSNYTNTIAFSSLKYELVSALHLSQQGYISQDAPFSEYDNVVGECFEKYFVSGCLYKNGEIKIPCFQCQDYYPPLGINDPCTYNNFQNCNHCGFLGCEKQQ